MRIGADRKTLLVITIALLTIVSSACAQTKEGKNMTFKEHAEKAVELDEKGDVKGAIQENLLAIKLNENDAKLWVNMTRFYLDANELEKAKKAGQKAIELDPKEGWAYFLYSEALERLHDNNNALAERKKAVELIPDNLLFRVNLGSIQEVVKDYKSAKESYEKALGISPNDISALYRLGSLEAESGNFDKAGKLLEKAVNTPPTENGDQVFIAAAQKELDKIPGKKP